MADSKISNLGAITSLSDDDLLVVVNDPAGTPTTNKITVANALGGKADLSGATFTGDVSLGTRLLLADGSSTAPAIGFTNDANSGLYHSAGAFRVAFNGTQTFAFADGIAYSDTLVPSSDIAYELGGASNRWSIFYTKDGDFSGSVTLGDSDTDTITVNGVLTNGAQVYDGVGNVKIGYRNIPQVTKSASYTLTTSDVGKHINVDTVGANITIPDATFSAGDVVSVVNNTANDAYMPCSITSGYIAGVNANKNGTNFTIPTRGIATILFLSSTVCVVSGNVS